MTPPMWLLLLTIPFPVPQSEIAYAEKHAWIIEDFLAKKEVVNVKSVNYYPSWRYFKVSDKYRSAIEVKVYCLTDIGEVNFTYLARAMPSTNKRGERSQYDDVWFFLNGMLKGKYGCKVKKSESWSNDFFW